MNKKIIFLLLLSLLTLAKDDFFFGNNQAPKEFCLKHDLKTILFTQKNTVTKGFSNSFDSLSQLISFQMTSSQQTGQNAFIFLQDKMDLQNGFILSFNMAIENPTCYTFKDSYCKSNINNCWWRFDADVDSRCGADGFAVVVRHSSLDTQGRRGNGIGYRGMFSAFAIEFDTFTNRDLNDPPTENERHISVIAAQGENTGNEDDSLAWNYKPINFKSRKFEGFVANPRYRIEYLNKILKVFINDILQLALYDPIDIQTILNHPSALSYIGITSSIGGLSEDHTLSQVDFKVVLSSPPNFKLSLKSSSTINAGEVFDIDLLMFDACKNRYIPNFEQNVDNENLISLEKVDGCSIMNILKGNNYKFGQSGPAFTITMVCTKIGNREFSFSYASTPINEKISVTIISGALFSAEVLFLGGSTGTDPTEGTTDTPYEFIVKLYDRNGNRVVIQNIDLLREKIQIVWPNEADSRTDYEITHVTFYNFFFEGIYKYKVDCQFVGLYKVVSKLFVYIVDKTYFFNIFTGAPDSKNTVGRIYDLKGNKIVVNELVAGSEALLKVTFVDRNGNFVTKITPSLYAAKLNFPNGVEELINAPNIPVMNSKFKFTKAGGNYFTINYKGKSLSCPLCQFNIIAGSKNFTNIDLYSYISIESRYAKTPALEIVKPQKLDFLLVLKDDFFNELSSINIGDYSAVLMGNNMLSINLKLTSFANGARLEIPVENKEDFDSLIGRNGYKILIKEISSSKTKEFLINIISDGSDSDADNGPYLANRTTFTWLKPLINANTAMAGESYRILIQLNTASGKRFNKWIDEKLVLVKLTPVKAGDQVLDAKRSQKAGTYTIEFSIFKVDADIRTGTIFVDAVQALKNFKFKTVANQAANLEVAKADLTNSTHLKEAIVFYDYSFKIELYDQYQNPSNAVEGANLDLNLQNSESKDISFNLKCPSLGVLGQYGCKITPQYPGLYILKSSYAKKEFKLNIRRGEPSIITTNASIVNDVSVGLNAGETVKFRFIPKDSSGNLLMKIETQLNILNYTLFLKDPLNQVKKYDIFDTYIQNDGSIIIDIPVFVKGSYAFTPLLFNKNIMCEVCAFDLNPLDVDVSKTKVFVLLREEKQQIFGDQLLIIDNTKIIPIFYVQFYDKYDNKRDITSNFIDFEGSLSIKGTTKKPKYDLVASEVRGDQKFVLKGEDYPLFQTELSNSNCSLSFKAKNSKNSTNPIDVSLPRVALKGKDGDSIYSDDYPTPENIRINPKKLEFSAGDYQIITIELRGKEDKLFYDRPEGWYNEATIKEAFQLKLDNDIIDANSFNVTKGKYFGTYSISFTVEEANYNSEALVLSYLDRKTETKSFIEAKQVVNTLVKPNLFDFIVVQTKKGDVESKCISSNKKTLQMIPYDRYSNKIYDIDSISTLGFNIQGPNKENILGEMSVPINGIYEISMLCKKAGDVVVTSKRFKADTKGDVIISYNFKIVAGELDPVQSYAELNKNKMIAGESLSWSIYPFDSYGNKIKPSENVKLLNYRQKDQQANYVILENIKFDNDKFYSESLITEAGVHYFKAFYKNQTISSTKNTITVLPESLVFKNSKLAKYEKKTGDYLESDSFAHDISDYPEFKLNFYDQFENRLSLDSANLLNYSLYLQDANITYSERIEFCSSIDQNKFIICSQNAADQSFLAKTPRKRWEVLVANEVYGLYLVEKSNIGNKIKYQFNITGFSSNETKNLPYSVENTIVLPKDLKSKAGENVSLTIELRTTNPNFRRNQWFDDPMSSIKLQFKYEEYSNYNIKIVPDVTDRYLVTLISNKTYYLEDPNEISFIIEGVKFTQVSKWTVNPSDLSSIKPINLANLSEVNDIPQEKSIDSAYETSFFAKDAFGNMIIYSSGEELSIALTYESSNVNFQREILTNGVIKLRFQPKIAGKYIFLFSNSEKQFNFSTVLLQGEISIQNTVANLFFLNNVIPNEIKAGNFVQIRVYAQDQYGNVINVDKNILIKNSIKYFFTKPNVQGVIVGEQPANLVENNVEFKEFLTKKGQFSFKVSVNDQEIRMITNLINIIPSDFDLEHSILKYFDDEAGRHISLDKNIALREDNLKENPNYLLSLCDIYDNEIDTFTENSDDFIIQLTGNDYTNSPIFFKSKTIISNYLSISLLSEELQKYKNGIYEQEPYRLKIELKKQSIEYKIILLGQGEENDKDAEINVPEDLSKTFISKNLTSFKAGEFDTFLIEIRTANGKRKADFDKNITFKFSDLNGNTLANTGLNASYENATLRGRYIVTITGEKANNNKLPYNIQMLVLQASIPSTVNITIYPNKLSYIESASPLNIPGTTDDDFMFDIIPYDKFGNVVEINENELNLKIFFPTSSSIYPASYSCNRDPLTNKLIYIVKNRIAGVYRLESVLFKDSKEKTFIIQPGKVSLTTSLALIEPARVIVAGEEVTVSILAYDQYNNFKNISDFNQEKELLTVFALSFKQDENTTQITLQANSLFGGLNNKLVLTKAGKFLFKPELKSLALPCNGCDGEVIPAELDLQKTKFLSKTVIDTFNETTLIEVFYGAKVVNFKARLFDRFLNPLLSIDMNSIFKLTMSGNNMEPIEFKVESDAVHSLYCSISESDGDNFSRLVPRNNYTLTLDLYQANKKIDNVKLGLKIIGDDEDAGNGNWKKIKISPQSIRLTAGVKSFINVELRTSENLRFNGIFNVNLFQAEEDLDSQYPDIKLKTEFFYGDKNGKYIMSLEGTTSFKEYKIFVISVNNTKIFEQRIQVALDPALPDLTKTNIVWPTALQEVKSDAKNTIQFKLYDRFGNLFTKSDFTTKLSAKVVNNGSAIIEPTDLDEGNSVYTIRFTAIYPPRILEIMIYYSESNTTTLSILLTPMIFIVTTTLDLSKTELIGSMLNGFTIEQDLSLTLLIKDFKGYCYEPTLKASVLISGPYLTNDLQDRNYTSDYVYVVNRKVEAVPKSPGSVTEEDQRLADSGFLCQKYYEISLKKNEIQNTGYYEIEIFVQLENETSQISVKTIRKTYVGAGEIDPRNTLFTVPLLYNRGNNPVNVRVRTPMTFHAILRDRFKNIINEDREFLANKTFSILLPSFKEKDYITTFKYNRENSTFIVTLNVQKTGIIKNPRILLDTLNMTIDNFEVRDFPKQISILPGPCSPKTPSYVGLDKLTSNVTNVVVGDKQTFTIQCQDEYENILTKGGDSFIVSILGVDLITVGTDIVNADVRDLNNGQYEVSFHFSWAGEYNVTVMLNKNYQYGNLFKINVLGSRCPPSTPFYCLLNETCASSYIGCNYHLFSCKETQNPVLCSVGGTPTCVSKTRDCDCEKGYTSCPDGRCVKEELFSDYCPFPELVCPDDFPHICPDGLCRNSEKNCPSIPGCPPGTKACEDLTCIDLRKECPKFDICPFEKAFRCADMTCASENQFCSTRITCSNPDHIVCPDKTCAKSELECKLPSECPTDANGNQMVLCPDQSCRSKKEECPNGITCSLGYALCEDGVCRIDCSEIIVVKSRRLLHSSSNTPSKLYRLLANSSSNETTNITVDTNCLIRCPGGECSDSFYKCPSVETCPTNYFKCPDQSCAKELNLCVKKTCDSGLFLCWDGSCQKDKSKCPTRTTCPNDYVKCADGSCVKQLQLCKEPIKCPAYKPYMCANGDCRTKSSECPTLVTCPVRRPVLCNDNSCRKNKNECLLPYQKLICEENKIVCPDGSCASSKDLCPTIQSCNPGQVRCWDNSCADELSLCPILESDTSVCPETTPLRCPDGSCRVNPKDCPTQIICPSSRPVKCDDGTCKESNSQCATNTQCPQGFLRCPDGSCSKKSCGVPLTCSKSAPFKCYDGTCKIDPRDCPEIPTCSEKSPILCPDGTCVSQRLSCKGYPTCLDGVIRCPDNFCYDSVDKCVPVIGCSGGRVLCEDGSCANSLKDCPIQKCPAHLQNKCFDGFCVRDLSFCDNQLNGCPYNKPIKCLDGTCSFSNSTCPNITVQCSEKDVLCPDGSCAHSLNRCPNAAGCPLETPIKCASGLCIDPVKAECPVANCPKEAPIKCSNGLCAKSISFCSAFLTLEDYRSCLNEPNGNNIPCADGRCVANADLCKPLFQCDDDSARCNDGSCRPIKQLCPLTNSSCPSNRPYRCKSGACAVNDQECPADKGCTNQNPVKCAKSGTCAKDEKDCEDVYEKTLTMNWCPIHKPYKCDEGTCKESESLCLQNNKGCPDLSKKYRCSDGFCVANITECRKPECKPKYKFTCPDGSCNDDYSKCNALNGCPVLTPFKCADGNCTATPFSLGNNENNCKPIVICPKYKPYLCADGECQGDRSLCRSQQACPLLKKIRCPDMKCVNQTSECSKNLSCPITTPILCSNGLCTSNALECISDNLIGRTEEKPFLCSNGEFVQVPGECVNVNIRNGYPTEMSRILEEQVNSTNNSVILLSDPGCPVVLPFRCPDGSCRNSLDECEVIKACPLYLPYRCKTGLCQKNPKLCLGDASLSNCFKGTQRCEDGYCRLKCPGFNGCPTNLPFHCSNGFCARKQSECAGDSACPLATPYRCVDNSCVKDMTKCSTPKRNYRSETMKISVASTDTKNFEFIQAGFDSAVRLAKIIIPAGAILDQTNNNTKETDQEIKTNVFLVSAVAESDIKEYNNPIHRSRKDYTEKLFPLSDAILSHHQSVRSPIVNIKALGRNTTEYRVPIILYLATDLAINSSKKEDYCLGKLNETLQSWVCNTRKLVPQEFESEKLGYPVSEDGIYSVIFNPVPDDDNLKGEKCGWFCENKMTLVWILISILCFGVVGSFIFWRISRYMSKYRVAKKQMDNYREQISELEQASTDIKGQSLKDKIEGISFTVNPAFKESPNDDLSTRIFHMEEVLEKLSKRDKVLDNANRDLKDRNSLLVEEHNNLKNECINKGL